MSSHFNKFSFRAELPPNIYKAKLTAIILDNHYKHKTKLVPRARESALQHLLLLLEDQAPESIEATLPTLFVRVDIMHSDTIHSAALS
jgi:hypothetical protein